MSIRNLIALIVLGSVAMAAWAQHRKSDVIVGVNWQGVPSTAIPDGSVAWFLDPAQNRVMACYSTRQVPKPICHAGDLSQGAAR